MDALWPLTFWHWCIAGMVLLGLELFAPGAVFLWLGIAAWITGALLWLVPSLAWQAQFVVFSAASLLSLFAWRHYRRHNPVTSDRPTLNRRGEQYIGRVLVLDEALENGSGRVRLGDSVWKVTGPDIPAGARVRITGVDGAVLMVQPEV